MVAITKWGYHLRTNTLLLQKYYIFPKIICKMFDY